jgi:hypothetical protein
MGSRVGSHVALKESVAALISLGYPKCSSGERAKFRDNVPLDLPLQ